MNKGRDKLIAVLGRTKGVYVAARCNVHKSRVTRWASGESKPAPASRKVLDSSYGIKPHEWDNNRHTK